MPPAQQPAKRYVVWGGDADEAPVGVVGVSGRLTITEGTIVGDVGGSVGVVTVKLSVVVASGGGILIIAGGGRIGGPCEGGTFGIFSDGGGSIGIVMMRTLRCTSQTDHCVNSWSRRRLHLVTGAEDKVNTALTTCWSF